MSDRCLVCISRDRDTIVDPVIKKRMGVLLIEAIALMRARPIPSGMRGFDSVLSDSFVAYARQLTDGYNMFYDHYVEEAANVCWEIASKLTQTEVVVLAAYSEKFSEYWCRTDFDDREGDREPFDPWQTLADELDQMLGEAAVNLEDEEYREDLAFGTDDEDEDDGAPDKSDVS
jgi:hypothetical protein